MKKILALLLLLNSDFAAAITVQAVNNTGSQIVYSAESVTIPANSTVTVPANVLVPFSQDPAVNNDILLGNLLIGDTVNTYGGGNASAFLTSSASLQTMLDKTGSGSLTASQPTQGTPVAGGTVTIVTNGASSVGASVTGTWTGTIVVDGTFDGSTWFTLSPLSLSTGMLVLSFTSNTNIIIGSGSFVQVRLRMSAFTSGTASVTFNAASGNNVILVSNTIASNLKAQVTSGASSSGTPTQTSVSCGTSSTTLLAASTATKFMTIRNPASGAATVWINFAGAAAVTSAPSFDLAIGSEKSFYASENSFLPTAQINCISGGITASTVTLIYK